VTTPRQRRVAEAIMADLGQLLIFEVNDPRLRGVTVTEVQIDRELQYADIYVNALGQEERQEEVLEALKRASGFFRRMLSQSLDLRKMPELRFAWDTAFEQAARIDELLDSLDFSPDQGGDSD
jgi:ribosome-binding factor A